MFPHRLNSHQSDQSRVPSLFSADDTTTTTTSTTKESLGWFRSRRDRWKKSPRRKVKPLQGASTTGDETSGPTSKERNDKITIKTDDKPSSGPLSPAASDSAVETPTTSTAEAATPQPRPVESCLVESSSMPAGTTAVAPKSDSTKTTPTKPSQHVSTRTDETASELNLGFNELLSKWKDQEENSAPSTPSSITTRPADDGTTPSAAAPAPALSSEATRKEEEEEEDDEQQQPYKDRLIAFYQKHNPSKLATVDQTLEKYRGKEDELFTKLEQKYVAAPISSALPPDSSEEGPRCFLETTQGRITIQLWSKQVPLACENFRALCTGEKGIGRRSGKPLCFRQTPIHRIVSNFCIQGGDITKQDGTGGESIYAPNLPCSDMWGKFIDEKPFLPHARAGLVSMANNGPNRNSSQFFITLRALPHLNNKHVVFGTVVEGMEVVESIGHLPTASNQRPLQDVMILDCGEIINDKEIRASELLKKESKQDVTAPQSSSSTFPASSFGGPISGSHKTSSSATTEATGDLKNQDESSTKEGDKAPFGSAKAGTSIFGSHSMAATTSFGSIAASTTGFGQTSSSSKSSSTFFGVPTSKGDSSVSSQDKPSTYYFGNTGPSSNSFYFGDSASKPTTSSSSFSFGSQDVPKGNFSNFRSATEKKDMDAGSYSDESSEDSEEASQSSDDTEEDSADATTKSASSTATPSFRIETEQTKAFGSHSTFSFGGSTVSSPSYTFGNSTARTGSFGPTASDDKVRIVGARELGPGSPTVPSDNRDTGEEKSSLIEQSEEYINATTQQQSVSSGSPSPSNRETSVFGSRSAYSKTPLSFGSIAASNPPLATGFGQAVSSPPEEKSSAFGGLTSKEDSSHDKSSFYFGSAGPAPGSFSFGDASGSSTTSTSLSFGSRDPLTGNFSVFRSASDRNKAGSESDASSESDDSSQSSSSTSSQNVVTPKSLYGDCGMSSSATEDGSSNFFSSGCMAIGSKSNEAPTVPSAEPATTPTVSAKQAASNAASE